MLKGGMGLWVLISLAWMTVLALALYVERLRKRLALTEEYISQLGIELENETTIRKKSADSFVAKSDPTYALVMKILEEAGMQGEGLFLVRRLENNSYLWKVDQKDVVQVHPSQLKRG